jgi:hypothetical protein
MKKSQIKREVELLARVKKEMARPRITASVRSALAAEATQEETHLTKGLIESATHSGHPHSAH